MTKNADTLIGAATSAVQTLEQLPVDRPYADALSEAQRAIDALAHAAHVELFPRALTPAMPAVLADLAFLERSELIELEATHGQALLEFAELAAALRGPRGRRIATERAGAEAAGASDTSQGRNAIAGARLAQFDQTIAEQLAAAGQLQPWSDILARTVPALQARIAAVVSDRQAHVEEDLQREAAARAEEARVLEQARHERRRQLIARAYNLPGQILVTGLALTNMENPTTGPALANRLKGVTSDDVLDVIEQAIASAEAALATRRQTTAVLS